ncbi:MAG TPA: glycoside-pentoside-hexuronide (GPH):cation symporter [Spirochaetia bacterium]|nr:glycoside-pentoside-hexuronide (GPH):cation symporter [Spirochaetia bacterium]
MMKDGYTVPVREKLSYGLGDFANNVAYGGIGFYFIFFLTDVAGVPAGIAGTILLIARLWDAITDYFMGVISDRTRSRFGRRRPYILAGSLPFGIAFALLWIIPTGDPVLLFLYYTGATVLFNSAFTVVAIPYNSMLPELTQNYDERTSIAGYKMSLSFVGTLVAAAGIMLFVDVIFPGKPAYAASFPLMGIVFGAVITATLIVTFAGTRERIVAPAPAHPAGLFSTFRSILRLREFRIVLAMFLFNMVGFDLIQTLLIYFLKHVVQIPDALTFVIMAIPLLVAIAAAPFWISIGQKFGKRKAYIWAAIYLTATLLVCLLVPVGDLALIVVVASLAGVGISASQVIPFSIVPDVIEIDEYQNGVRREGAFYGITMFLYKVASAVAIAGASALLGLFGYIETTSGSASVVQPASAITGIRVLLGVGPGIFFLISAYFVYRLPITRERFEEIKRLIEERRK